MQRCTELNVTNRSRAYPGRHRKEIQKDEERLRFAWKTTEAFTADVGWRDLKLHVWIRYNGEQSEQLYSVLREHKYIRLRGQAVKTSPFHGGNTGSIPVGVINWDLSSAGRASALQAEGHRFEPCRSHFCFSNNRVRVIAFFILKFAFLYKYAIMK